MKINDLKKLILKTKTLNKILLLFSSIILFLIALSFGANPLELTTKIYQVDVSTINAVHTFRSVMGLIFGLVAFWLFGAFNDKYALPALYSLLFAMLGLVTGRTISFLFDDGQPLLIFTIYVLAEFSTGITTALLIRKNHKELEKE